LLFTIHFLVFNNLKNLRKKKNIFNFVETLRNFLFTRQPSEVIILCTFINQVIRLIVQTKKRINMKKKLLPLLGLLFFIGTNTSSFAVDKDADKIIEKYLKAIGGKKNWEKIKTIRAVSHLEMIVVNDDHNIWYNTEYVRNEGMRIESYVNHHGIPSLFGVNNLEAWRVVNIDKKNPFAIGTKPVFLTKDIKNNKDSSTYDRIHTLKDDVFKPFKFLAIIPWSLLDYKERGFTAILKGKKNIWKDQLFAFEIELRAINGITATYYILENSYYLEKVIFENVEFTYANYKDVENVKMPFTEYRKNFNIIDKGFAYPITSQYTIDVIALNPSIQNESMNKPTN
jgi:hypothetical protein